MHCKKCKNLAVYNESGVFIGFTNTGVPVYNPEALDKLSSKIDLVEKENADLRRQLAEAGRFYNINEKWVRIDEKRAHYYWHSGSCACWMPNNSPYCRE